MQNISFPLTSGPHEVFKKTIALELINQDLNILVIIPCYRVETRAPLLLDRPKNPDPRMSRAKITVTTIVVLYLKYLMEDKATTLRRRSNVYQEAPLKKWP